MFPRRARSDSRHEVFKEGGRKHRGGGIGLWFAQVWVGERVVPRVEVSIFRVIDQFQPRSRMWSVGWATCWFVNRKERSEEAKYSL